MNDNDDDNNDYVDDDDKTRRRTPWNIHILNGRFLVTLKILAGKYATNFIESALVII